jgi:hypothetical protein
MKGVLPTTTMRNLTIFLSVSLLIVGAIVLGSSAVSTSLTPKADETDPSIPHIGSVQVLNGCGIDGAAQTTAEFLRRRGFDVKNIENARTWNYPFTIVAARSPDMSNARRVAKALKTDKVVLMRRGEYMYDVDVLVGPDFGERTQ